MENKLAEIIDGLSISQTDTSRMLGCSKANISARVARNSDISGEELYKLFKHAKEKGWNNKIAFLSPHIHRAFSRLRQPDRVLAEITPDPWQDLTIFFPSRKEASHVIRLLGMDGRPSYKKRMIKIYLHQSIGPGEISVLCEQLRVRFDLTLYRVDEIPFISAFLLLGDEIPLIPGEAGFQQLSGSTAESYKMVAKRLTKKMHPCLLARRISTYSN